METKEKLTLALDVNTLDEALELVNRTKNYVGYYKVGKEILNAVGLPVVLKALKALDVKVFVDVKEMDIPNTVKNAVVAAARHGADIINIHASGGRKMMEDTVKAAKEVNPDVKIIAVSVLTSLNDDDMRDIGYMYSAETMVWKLALLAKEAGLDGLVCSPMELNAVRRIMGDDAFIITPGIKPAWDAKQADQKRVTTPREAVVNGTSSMVVGRSITKHAAYPPCVAAQKIYEEIREAMQEPKVAGQTLNDIFVGRLLEAGVVKTGQFKLKNGTISPIYINVRDLPRHHAAMSMALFLMSAKIAEARLEFDRTGGVPMGALSIANMLSFATGRSILTLRNEAKDHGLVGTKTVEGFVEGENVLVIEDVATSGGSIKEAVEKYRFLGLNVSDAFVVVDRQQGAGEMLAEEGVTLHGLITLEEIVEALYKREDIDDATKQAICDYMK